ncbi:uncharacterized protein MONBRDRAFT_34084 [Monosiga brevicollis MX1]|uniref:Uncharacterized protein n=1 Tax=Monosiga brevicollis TaxID=81824 RepID=A9V9D2_MONBE|nr:uncharacterized protein MONBRDRAFT_34084 [Monosiga brevicollis MX1]EDQ85909.1 predicted protein [Monosiga brevicollis MX1]|eukprot:XP_001749388.1 hypothetical protein [Monosiga brevicollis MX1]
MAYLSPKLVMFSMAVLPPVVGGAIWLNRRMKRQQRLVQDALAEATSQAADTLGNIRLVRDFGQEHVEYDRYARAIDVTYHTALQVGRSNALLEGTVFWGVNMSLVAVLAVGSTMIASQEMTVGALTSFLLYSLYFGIHTNGMSNVYADLTRGLGASQRLFDLIDLPSDPTSSMPHDGARPRAVNILARDDEVDQQGIEAVLRHVTFAYPERPDEIVLEDYSLELPAGKSVGLCGSSGCGKSTVARLLTRLYDPSSGQVFFDGVDLRTLDPVEMRHNIGIVAQDALLFDRTVRENLMYGRPDATEAQLIEAAKQANAYEFICELPEGFDTEVGERGVTLSGGQRARLAIARALLRQPRLLILDEASAALDAVSEQQVHAALKAALTLNTGRMTTLLIAHRLATLKTADVIHVMDHGRIVESGSFQELEAGTGLFRQMLDAQSTASTA